LAGTDPALGAEHVDLLADSPPELGGRLSGRGAGALTGPGAAVAFELNGGLDAGAEARRVLIARDGDLPPAVRADVLLLLTELVTNAVRHSGLSPDQSLRVELRQWPRLVRVDVVDPGEEFSRVRPSLRGDENGGWGLFLVDRIATTWGVGRSGSGTCVWFEIELDR
jgi:anti-sigma regulatory factor (Ser/Thr protein kinase)